MDRDILGSFYNRLLPLFPPRTEAFLKSLTSEKLKQVNFRYIFTVDGMTEISHMIEDTIPQNPSVADMHVSFQYFSRFADQQERYKKVAENATGLWVYGVPDAPLPDLLRTIAVDTAGTPLEHYWFVIAYGAGVSAALLAEEITPEDRLPNEPRMYEGFYTFEAGTAFQILTLLNQMFPKQVPIPTSPEMMG
jgi:DICT domain-containing protein